MRNASMFPLPKLRVRGSIPKMLSPRYRALKPKNDRAVARGQSATSDANAEDQAFIWSETADGRDAFHFSLAFLCRLTLHEQNPLHLITIEFLIVPADVDNDVHARDGHDVATQHAAVAEFDRIVSRGTQFEAHAPARNIVPTVFERKLPRAESFFGELEGVLPKGHTRDLGCGCDLDAVEFGGCDVGDGVDGQRNHLCGRVRAEFFRRRPCGNRQRNRGTGRSDGRLEFDPLTRSYIA